MSLQDGGCSNASRTNMANASSSMRRRLEDQDFSLRVYPGALAEGTIYCPVIARKNTTAAEAIEFLIERLQLEQRKCYVLAEVKEFGGEEWILNPGDCPVQRMMLWPRSALENRRGLGSAEDYRFLLREKNLDGSIYYGGSLQMWLQVTEERQRLVDRGLLPQPAGSNPPADLCALPELTERALLDSLRARFRQEKIYTYVGSILIVINPFQFLPIYNPKFVKLYDNHTLGKLEPHIYAVADVAYHAMLQRKKNQCIVISGESGSGKTQSTNFLIHHLTALSQKGFASGVEQIILGAGPVLEAFGNAKTAHNNNSSRFGKFIQVNYQESGTVRGAYVEKYLLEKSRLVYQEHNERNYHVFYYLLAGAGEEERTSFHLLRPEAYHFLNQVAKETHIHWDINNDGDLDCFTVEGEDLKHDFERLQLAMEMVGFLPTTRTRIFSLLSAILHLGNIRYKKKTYRDDFIDISNPEVLPIVSELLEVREEMLLEALTTRQTVTVGERLIVPYKLTEAGTVRDSMAKSLYSALFDWIVFRINHALLNNKDLEENSKILSIGVLDIFGFEDYENNSFEQFCINFANERLQHYFNQHVFKLQQEEYRAEGINWHNIDYTDNGSCLNLISKKPTALFHLLDEECNFPQASNQTLLDKLKRQHEGNSYIEFPAVMEPAFIIQHYAGKVKYRVKDFREKNTDHMRPDIVALLKSSKSAFICSLMGIDPVATFRWAMLRAYFRAMVAFREAGRRHAHRKTGNEGAVPCAVVKSIDNFSFLHHPVHQRSLEILQRCKDESYSISRKNPRTTLADIQGATALSEKASWDGYGFGGNDHNTRSSRLLPSGKRPALEEDGIFLDSSNSKFLERAQGILMRNKHCKSKPNLPKQLLDVKSLRYLSSVTLHDRITKSLLHLHKKKKPPSISAQFQASLAKLMETLEQSEPYFVKCIRSNAEKLPLRFNDSLVLRQLRYTGMLETVRIQQSGYSVKYTFQEFVRHFHVLLPRKTSPTKSGIREFFRKIHLLPVGYQVGHTMVFLREPDRQHLQTLLHQEVLRRIIMLQRCFRAVQERKNFINLRRAARVIQRWWRSCFARESPIDQRLEEGAAVCLQAAWRSYREQRRFLQRRAFATIIQRSWRRCRHRRNLAAITLQTAWRRFRERRCFCRTYRAILLLQVMGQGHLARLRFKQLRESVRQPLTPLAQAEDESENDCQSEPADILKAPSAVGPGSKATEKKDLERSDGVDRSSHRTRSKREGRRMRELEQAQFCLELLKVRASTSPIQVGSGSRQTQVGPATSHQSFEAVDEDDMQAEEESTAKLKFELKPTSDHLTITEGPRATFYICSDQSPTHESKLATPFKRQEVTTRKSASVAKESPSEEVGRQTPAASEINRISGTGLEPNILSLSHTAVEITTSRMDVQNTTEQRKIIPVVLPIGQQCGPSAASPVTCAKPAKSQSKNFGQTVIVNMTEKPSATISSPPRCKLPFSKSDKDLVNQERSLAFFRDDTKAVRCGEGSHKEFKKIQKAMSSGDLVKVGVLAKTSSQEGRMRGKMRLWSKTKHNDKKVREKQMNRSNTEILCPPHHPVLDEYTDRVSKESNEPACTRRRCSLKISNVAMEPVQWQNDALHIITSAHDYCSLNDFLMKKIADLDSQNGKDTMIDVVFKKALKEFRIHIFNSYSTALVMDDGKSIRYKDLYALFEHILEKTMRLEQRDWKESPVRVWVNTFKVFLDEFMTECKPMEGTITRTLKRERKKTRKKETDIVEEHNGHIFKSTQYSIPTYCEFCSSLIWMMDRACVCKLCRYACHRKCCFRMTTQCSKKYDLELSSRQFGVELSRLTSEERTVPQLVEKLINYIEMHGLYTEGIYRKSGSTNKIKELRQGLDTDVGSVNLDEYNIHVIASVLKQWLRDLPSPLMTFELYEEFLRAIGQSNKSEVIHGVYSVIEQLSRTHLSTLERLIFHLIRIVLQEETNRMSANALAIVFAPCILRCPDSIDPLQSVQDISKTTACVELIINEQLSKYRARLKDISTLEFAESNAKIRLSHIRRSLSKSLAQQSGSHSSMTLLPLSPKASGVLDGETAREGKCVTEGRLSEQQQAHMLQEERILSQQIDNLQREKEELTYEMLILEPQVVDDDTLDSEDSTAVSNSCERITMETEDCSTYHPRKSEAKSRRTLRRHPDFHSADSASNLSFSCHASVSSASDTSPGPTYRFRSSSSGPLLTSCSFRAPEFEADGDRAQKATKARQRLRLSRSSPREPSGSHRRDSDFSSSPPQLVPYGSNDFMV
ncbi:unconventional myosin-IXAa-like isoform 1-T1 [Synchiropus picturatus]